MIISAQHLLLDGVFTGPGAVVVADGLISAVLREPPGNADIVLTQGCLTPGLIDIHNNGAFGVDFCAATPADWDDVIARLAACGVTSVLPTIITAPLADIHEAAARCATAMARHKGILGLHLEGPFLAPAKRGAHRRDWLAAPSQAALDALLADAALRSVLRMVTLAPELPGALAAISRLVQAGIRVALGHTDATAAEMRAAAAAGASLVTHVFNAQSALSHRAPGAPGVALTDPRLHPCVIVDGLHLDPMIMQLAFAACPRAVAVTDSILIAGLPAGEMREFGGMKVMAGPEGIGRRPDGTLAGAGITLDEGVRRMIAAGIPAEVAFTAATERPAAALGVMDRGRIAPGMRADLVWWDDDFVVRQVWTGGAAKGVLPAAHGTEYARPALHDLDERATGKIVAAFLAQERAAQAALAGVAGQLAALADAVAGRLAAGGRLFYAGAGTSGRLALLDAVECGPTFGVPEGLIIPLLAGGDGAFLRAVEGAEDDEAAAVLALQEHGFGAGDALVGIAASGATPFTLAAVRYAQAQGGLTGAIVNNPGGPMAALADIALEIASGPEVIAGSTRLSAGSTQKIALNILSSTVMIRLGKTYGPYMVDLRATNAKLRRRAARMVAVLAGVEEAAANTALVAADMHVKTAILVLRQNLNPDQAREKLAAANGSLRKALRANP
jgi:N-acetylmuramic acid 6-phosphate etherase/N-acetylglucosamine-6-phosphate deacetylase